MEKKIYQSTIELKEAGEPGEFQAVFSTFNVIDKDGDVTLPGAFEDGQKVRISYWGHRWSDLPVGKGEIHADETKAWVDGKFFLDTEAGLETYKTVKNLEDLQEWSYGFDVIEADLGKYEEQDVTFLKRLTVHEVSPVLLGAGIGTGTTLIKGKEKQLETTESAQTEDEASDGKSSGDVQPDFTLKKKQLDLYKLETIENEH
jgi:HK97 family phage prohead protease